MLRKNTESQTFAHVSKSAKFPNREMLFTILLNSWIFHWIVEHFSASGVPYIEWYLLNLQFIPDCSG